MYSIVYASNRGKFVLLVQTTKFSCARKNVQKKVTRSHYAISFLFKKVVTCFGKIRSPVDRPISGRVSRQKLARNRTCSTPASFWRQFFLYQIQMAPETPFTQASFLAEETCSHAYDTVSLIRDYACGTQTQTLWPTL